MAEPQYDLTPGAIWTTTCATAVSFLTTANTMRTQLERHLFFGAQKVQTGVEWLESRVNEIIDKAWD